MKRQDSSRRQRPADLIPQPSKQLTSLSRRYGVELILLFGSRARGDARRESDLDIGVLYTRPPAPSVQGALESHLLDLFAADVHLVSLNTANPDLRIAASREGKVLYQQNPWTWMRFVIASIHLAHDARRLRQYDDDIVKRFLEKRANDKGIQRGSSAAAPGRTHPGP